MHTILVINNNQMKTFFLGSYSKTFETIIVPERLHLHYLLTEMSADNEQKMKP